MMSSNTLFPNQSLTHDGKVDQDSNIFNKHNSSSATKKQETADSPEPYDTANFTSIERNLSSYFSSLIAGFQDIQQLQNASASQALGIVETAQIMYGSAQTLGEKMEALHWAEENLELHAKKEVVDGAEETYLKEIKEQIDEELEKLSKEMEGIEKLLEEVKNGGTNSEATEEEKTTTDSDNTDTAPEITVSGDTVDGVVTLDVPQIAEPAPTPTPTPSPEVVANALGQATSSASSTSAPTPPPPSTPSVDIYV